MPKSGSGQITDHKKAEKNGIHAGVPRQETVSRAPAAGDAPGSAGGAAKEEDERSAYFMRMLEHSRDENLRLQLKTEQEFQDIDLGEWAVVHTIPDNKLAVAGKQGAKGRTEADRVKAARAKNPLADACTIRELPLLTQYFQQNNVLTEDADKTRIRLTPALGSVGVLPYIVPGDSAADKAEKLEQQRANVPVLKKLVQAIVETDFSPEMLTDEYLSRHIAEVYDYALKLRYYNNVIVPSHGYFLEELTEEERMVLKTRSGMAESLKRLLEVHMENHGILLSEIEEDGVVGRSYSVREMDAYTARRTEFEDFEALREDFLTKTYLNEEIRTARLLAFDENFRSGNVLKRMSRRIGGDLSVVQSCADEIRVAFGEAGKALKFRDSVFEEQKTLLEEITDKEELPENFEGILAEIAKNNKIVLLATKHADHYSEFIEFGLGNTESVSEETLKFLESENQDSLLKVVQFRNSMDSLEKAALLHDGGKLSDYDPLNSERFLDDLAVAKAKAESVRDILEKGRTNRSQAEDEAAVIAREYHLVKAENKDFSGSFIDPYMAQDTFIWIVLATQYETTEDTPAAFRKEIADKGVRPFLDVLTAMTPEMLEEMRVKPDTYIGTPAYWQNRTLLGLIADGGKAEALMRLFRKHDIALSDELYIGIRALSETAREMYAGYELHDEKMTDPLTVLVSDEKYAPKLGGIAGKLSEKATGADERLRKTAEALVQARAGEMLKREDFMERLDREKEMLAAPLKAEEKKLQPYYGDEGERTLFASYRLAVKSEQYEEEFPASHESIALWGSRMDGLYGGAGSIMLFRRFLKEVKKDRNGAPVDEEEVRANYDENNADIRDFVSGNIERRSRVLEKIGLSVLYRDGKRTEGTAFLSPDPRYASYDFIHDNYIEVREYCLKMEAFKEYYRLFPDIFNGGLFSEAERRAFKTNIIENEALSVLTEAVKEFGLLFGIPVPGSKRAEKLSKEGIDERRNRLKELLTGDLSKLTVKKQDKKEAKPKKKAAADAAPKAEQPKETEPFPEAEDVDEFAGELEKELARCERAPYDEILRRRAAGSFASAEEEKQCLERLKIEYTQKATRLRKNRKYLTELKGVLDGSLAEIHPEAMVFAMENGIDVFEKEQVERCRFNLEKAAMGTALYNNDDEVRLRLMMKAAAGDLKETMSETQIHRWREKFGAKAEGIGDPDFFRQLLKPVRRDCLGRVLEGYRENDEANRAVIEAFLTDDKAGIEAFLHELGTRVAGISDKYSANLTVDELKRNTEEGYKANLLGNLFRTVYAQYMDFFESGSFSAEEKRKLRTMGTESELNEGREAYWDALTRQLGLEKDLKDMNPGEGVTFHVVRDMAPEEMRRAESLVSIGRAKQQKIGDAYAANAQRIDELSTLMAAQAVKKGDKEAGSRAGLFGAVRALLFGVTKDGAVKDISREKKSFLSGFLDRFRKKNEEEKAPVSKKAPARRVRKEIPEPELTEEEELKEIQEENADADIGTVRIARLLGSYFGEGGHKTFGEDGTASDAELKAHLDHLLKRRFDPKRIDDEYLIIHAAELYEYSLSLKDIPKLKRLYPAYFAALTGEERAGIEKRVCYAEYIDKVLKEHFALHCIDVQDGYVRWTPEYGVLSGRDKKSVKDWAELRRHNFEGAVEALKENLSEQGLKILRARLLSDDKSLDGGFERTYIQKIEAAALEGVAGTYAATLSVALGQEIAKRNTTLGDLSKALLQFDQARANTDKAALDKARKDVEVLSERLSAETDGVSEYYDLLRFAVGDIPFIPGSKVSQMAEKASNGTDKRTFVLYRGLLSDLVIEAGHKALEQDEAEKEARLKAMQEAQANALSALEKAQATLAKAPVEAAAVTEEKAEGAGPGDAPVSLTLAEQGMKDMRPSATKKKEAEAEEEAVLSEAETEAARLEAAKRNAAVVRAEAREVSGKDVGELIHYTVAAKNRVVEILSREWPFIQELLGQEAKIPENGDDLATIRMLLEVEIARTDDDGKVVIDTKTKQPIQDRVFDSQVSPIAAECFNWLRNYYAAYKNDEEALEAERHMEDYIPEVHAEVRYTLPYELQGTNNCYCCTAAALFNQFMMNADGRTTLTESERITQTQLRNFRPEYRSYEEFKRIFLAALKLTEDSVEPEEGKVEGKVYTMKEADIRAEYDRAVEVSDRFMGDGKIGIGSIFEIADFLLQKRQDFAMFRMKISTPAFNEGSDAIPLSPEEKEELYIRQKTAFIHQVGAILSQGNLAGILEHGENEMKHYRTITAIHGNVVTLMDSLHPERRDSVTVEELMKRHFTGNNVELTWLEKIDDPASFLENKSGLAVKYTPEEGFTQTAAHGFSVEEAHNVAQRLGVLDGMGEIVPGFLEEAPNGHLIPADVLMFDTAVYLPAKNKAAASAGTD
ncbi:MAG: hypothetical protein K5985_07340 [Lachnospiraceae bacterium]|nr:hypothetical protein [Lachnospiraceae bacterium]